MPEPSLVDFLDNAARVRAGSAAALAADPRPGRFHRSMPGYRRSAVADAPGVAEQLGLERLVVKLEVERFGLPAFKVLGASWAICRALSARAGRDEPAATFDDLRELAAEQPDVTLVTATDGNHGRAVAKI
jgi:diaminopropionate ammonia-lyase